jgi:hypothetical protein
MAATTIAPNLYAEMEQEKREKREDRESRSQVMIVSKGEAMNPTWRATMEDLCVIHAAGEWGAPDQDMAYFGVYDGHGGQLIQQSHVLLSFVHFPHYPSSSRQSPLKNQVAKWWTIWSMGSLSTSLKNSLL